MKIAAIFTSFNEDPQEVLATITSFQASVLPGTDLDIIVIDDGSDTPLDLDCGIRLIRHDTPWGIGQSRNHGWGVATKNGADFVSMWDAHMRCAKGSLEHLAEQALSEPCLVSLASEDYRPDRGFYGCGTWMFWNRRDGLQIKWEMKEPKSGEWERTPCFLGACYGMSAETGKVLEAATGQLWEDTAGRWGVSEQALCVKAWLMDIPVYVSGSREFCSGHLYRSSNPVPTAGADVWRNLYRAGKVLFSHDVFAARFLPHCLKRVPLESRNEIDLKLKEEFPAGHARPWSVEKEHRLFKQLLGRDATCTSIHPDLASAEGQLVRATLQMANAGHAVKDILVWRPTEHLSDLRRAYPDATIRCIALAGARCDDWWEYTKALSIEMHRVQPGIDYWERPLRVNWGTFDLILISGPFQDKCENVAKAFLNPGGKMVVDKAGAERMLEHSDLTNERKAISSVVQKESNFLKSLPRALPSVKVPTVAALVLNWKRPDQLRATIDSLAKQIVKPKIYLWDNADKEENRYGEDDRVAVRIVSSENMGRFPRWWMGGLVGEDYICSLDDDIYLYDENVLDDAVSAQARLCPDGIVGFFGWNRIEGNGYKGGKHLQASNDGDVEVQLVKGRFMCLRSELLAKIPLRLVPQSYGAADDVCLSLFLGQRHFLPSVFEGRWVNQSQAEAASSIPGHYERRWEVYQQVVREIEGGKDANTSN